MIMDDELFDWELLHGSDTESTDSITSEKKSGSSSVIDDGMILFHHFSVDKLIDNSPDLSQHGVIETGESSRVDYGSKPLNSKAFLVDLGFDQSNANLLSDGCIKNELGVYDSVTGDGEVRLSAFAAADVAETNGGTLSLHDDKSLCFSESEDLEFGKGSAGEEPIEDSSKSWSDSGGNELVTGDSGSVDGEEEIVSDSIVASTEAIGRIGEDAVQVEAANSGDNSKSREIVWWKMPFLLLKYCTYRIGPVLSVSMVAAVMGLVLLGRRLYNIKKKAQRFNLKATIDDKKVSQVMSQAARLNEAFTEVRRVPVIRPALPSPGAWPVLSLR